MSRGRVHGSIFAGSKSGESKHRLEKSTGPTRNRWRSRETRGLVQRLRRRCCARSGKCTPKQLATVKICPAQTGSTKREVLALQPSFSSRLIHTPFFQLGAGKPCERASYLLHLEIGSPDNEAAGQEVEKKTKAVQQAGTR